MKQQPVLPDDTLFLLHLWIIIVAASGCSKANRLFDKAAGAVFFLLNRDPADNYHCANTIIGRDLIIVL